MMHRRLSAGNCVLRRSKYWVVGTLLLMMMPLLMIHMTIGV